MKKSLSMLLCFVIVITITYVPIVKASSALTDSEITSIVENYLSIVGSNRYWNANIRSNQELLKTQAKNKNYLAATTTSPCKANPKHSHTDYGNEGCTSNVFTGVSRGSAQCWGFGDYMEYVIFKTTDGSSWAKHTSVDSTFNFRPGDLIWSQKNSTSQHIMVVYKTNSDGSVKIIEGNYGGRCHINTRTLTDPHAYVNYSSKSYVLTPPSSLRVSSSTPEEPETGHTHSHWLSREAAHPHREFMVCSCGDSYYTGENDSYIAYEGSHPHKYYYVCGVSDCPYNKTYTGENNYSVAYEGSHPHKYYYVCGVSSCSYNKTYTGKTVEVLRYESDYPYKEYRACIENCSYDRTYTGDTAAPHKPTLKNMSATYSSSESIQLSWNAVKNATHYNLYFDILTNGKYVRTKTVQYATSGTTVSFAPGKYRVLLQATNADYWTADGSTWLYTDGDWVNFTVNERPSAPKNVKASSSGSKVTVSWDEVTNATNYDVYLVQSPWAWADIKYSQSLTGNTYTFSEVAEGTYKAFVIARPNSNKVQSKWVEIVVDHNKPAAPAIKHSWANGYGLSGGSITVSWDLVDNADKYSYYLTEYPERYAYTTNTQNGSTTENKVKFTNLKPGKYSVFVHAHNNKGRSGQSNWISFYVYEREYTPVITKEYNGHIYAVYDYEMSWSFAKELCQNMGGHLVTITSKEENDFISQMIDEGEKDAYWLGAADFDVPLDSYCWITKEEFDYANWDAGEPSGTGTSGAKEHFVEIRKSYGYKWNDVNNINKTNKGFILEIEPTTDHIVETAKFKGSQYLLIDANITWSEAKVYCESLGGHLVTLNSPEEKEFVNQFIQNGLRSWYYLGGVQKDDEWYWVDGSKAENIDWADNAANWNGGHLMKYKDKEGCISLKNTYYPAHDISRIGFVCEVSVEDIEAEVVQNSDLYTININTYNIQNSCDVIVAGYKGDAFVACTTVIDGVASLSGDIDKIKVMVWDDLLTLKPLCEAEEITSDKFIIG